ncbi:putative TonB related protein [uncultured Desulfobacterium sp.]|uniref:Putative TonB related protein n=1 Tax=uncultured Desulfobacterium sp. TaxID=201089 RepID=A0A445N0R2_9BACT|nr:putative TonB related protein [uncultured Desulfobacterium sp.]
MTNTITNEFPKPANRPNWLFRGLIGISLVIHIIIFMYVSGFYQTNVLSFIEMTLDDISKPFSRDIPRPRLKQKPVEKPRDVKKLEIQKQVMPQFAPIKLDNVDKNVSSGAVASINPSDIVKGSGLDLAGWDPGAMQGLKEIVTKKDYYDLIQLRIESNKKYPEMAKAQRIEGRTTVSFTIGIDGSISGLSIVTGSRDKTLDEAAVKAVEKASPFPRPPLKLFSGPIPIEITIVFETT